MGVYIKDIKMPSNCFECRFAVDGWCYAAEKQDNRDYLRETQRANWCPLIEIPPGRLIDADNLLKHRFVGVVGEKERDCYIAGWNTAIEAIVENAETVIGGE